MAINGPLANRRCASRQRPDNETGTPRALENLAVAGAITRSALQQIIRGQARHG
jgi:hypothetical protein